jgi:hypothetical protein
MDYNNTIKFNNIDKKLLITYKNNTLHNIQKVIDYYNPTIYCFQETSNYQDILKLFNHKYSYKRNISDKENMLTIWRNNKLDLIHNFEGEFEKGRPFNIIIFFNKIDNYKFILINIHAGHNSDTIISIINPIQNVINTIDNKLLIDIKRIIITGDFNRDINNEIKINKKNNNSYYLIINNKKITFKYNKNNNNTCCNIYGNNINKNYDNIIDSHKKLKLIHLFNKESWYKYPSSDHVMVMGIIKTPL